MHWEEFFNAVSRKPEWSWIGPWLTNHELIIEVDDVDPVSGRRKAWAAKGTGLSYPVPNNLYRVGCSGRTMNHLKWVFLDFDVGHGADPHANTEAAIAQASRVRSWLGFGEVRLSSSGLGVHLGIPLPWDDFKASDGPRIAKAVALATGVNVDRAACGRQCRYLWLRDPNQDSFRLIEPLDESKFPNDPPEALTEAFLGMVMAGEQEEVAELSVGPAEQYPLIETAPSHGRPKDMTPIDPSMRPDAVVMARNYMVGRTTSGRSCKGERNFRDIRVLANDFGLPTNEVNTILSSFGCPTVRDDEVDRMCLYCRAKRGWRTNSRKELIAIGSDKHVTGVLHPGWAINPAGQPWDALGKSTFLVWTAFRDRVTSVDPEGWSNPIRMVYEHMGNRALKTNQRAVERLVHVGLLLRFHDEFHWKVKCGKELDWSVVENADRYRVRRKSSRNLLINQISRPKTVSNSNRYLTAIGHRAMSL